MCTLCSVIVYMTFKNRQDQSIIVRDPCHVNKDTHEHKEVTSGEVGSTLAWGGVAVAVAVAVVGWYSGAVMFLGCREAGAQS